jgi:hypothetical protein
LKEEVLDLNKKIRNREREKEDNSSSRKIVDGDAGKARSCYMRRELNLSSDTML